MYNTLVIYLNYEYFTGYISLFIRHVKIRPNTFKEKKTKTFLRL